MTLTIQLPSEVEQALRLQADRSGQDVNAFVLQAIREKIAKAGTFEEICAPLARAVEAAGISDAECDRFFEAAREEVWREGQGHAS